MREKSEQKTNGKIIAFIPIFKSHFQQSNVSNSNRTYYEMEWRVLFEFKTYNGEIFRCIEDDKIFGGDRNALTHTFKLNADIPIKYNIENPFTACIKQDYLICEYKIGSETYKEKSQFPVNYQMFSVGEEIFIRYNANNYREYNVSYTIWK